MKIIAMLPSSAKENIYNLTPTLSFPDSAIIKNGNPFFIPDFDSEFSGCLYMAVKISRLGKNIAPRFASRYYSEAAPVIAVYAQNLLNQLREAGLPWTAATGFDKSLVVGSFTNYPLSSDSSCTLERSNSKSIIFTLPSPEETALAIHEISRYNSLKMGDLILIPIKTEILKITLDTLITIKNQEEILLQMPIR